MIAKKGGKVVRCPEEEFRPMGRNASGVKGVTLEGEDDYVVSMLAVDNAEDTIMVVSENGYGKRSDLEEYRTTHRGGKGVKTLQITEKTGKLVAVTNVTDANDLMIINRSGVTIRMSVADLRVMGRNTQGVKLINLRGKDTIASITKVDAEPEEAVVEESDNVETPENTDQPVNPEGTENMDNTESSPINEE